MGFLKKIFQEDEQVKEWIKADMQARIIAERLAEEREIRTTCKKCKKIFSEGIPYKKAMFGNPKNYVCKECAKELGLI